MQQITLPCGILSDDGSSVITSATITEFTAKVKKELGNKNINSTDSVEDIILKNCLKAIGDKPLKAADLDMLLSADKEYIIMKIREISFGDIIKGHSTCEDCDKKFGASLSSSKDLTFWSLKPIEQAQTATHPQTKKPVRIFEIITEDGKYRFICRYPTGEDMKKVAKMLETNPFEAKMRLIGNCTIEASIEGTKLDGPITIYTIESLPSRIYDYISDTWDTNQPGLDRNILVSCPFCNHDNLWAIDPKDFLSLTPTTEKAKGKLTKLSG